MTNQDRNTAIKDRQSEYQKFRDILLDIAMNEKHPGFRMTAIEMIFQFDDLDRLNTPYSQRIH